MKNFIYALLFAGITASCKKDKTEVQPESWQFTRLVNATLDKDGNMISLDFYQKKGDQWRILQFVPDDYTTFHFKDSITPNTYEMPIDNANAYMTCNARLFDPAINQIHYNEKLKWYPGAPVEFNITWPFSTDFPDMPAAYNNINKFSTASYSYEKAYDDKDKTDTYMFYDFPNQKYVYYAERSGADLVIENTLPLLCATCNTISWKDIDAVTSTNEKNSSHFLYLFDFDKRKMYLFFRENTDTNHPSFSAAMSFDFEESFLGKWTSTDQDKPFDFTK